MVHPPGHPGGDPPDPRSERPHPGALPTRCPDRLADQVTERDGKLRPPVVHQPARGGDKDHCQPYDRGGTTSSDNVAPLCRAPTTGPRPTTG